MKSWRQGDVPRRRDRIAVHWEPGICDVDRQDFRRSLPLGGERWRSDASPGASSFRLPALWQPDLDQLSEHEALQTSPGSGDHPRQENA